MEHMIFKGTPARPVGAITREINDAGGHVNAYTSFDRTVFYADLPAARWKVGLDVLADAVKNANFPEDEWRREREVVLREVSMGRDDPDRVISERLWQTAYAVHPYRFPIIGLPALLRQVERDDLLAFFQRHYVPDKMAVVVAGDIDPVDAEAAVRAAFEGFDRMPRAPIVLPAEPAQVSPRSARLEGAYAVTRLMLAWHTVPLSHPDTAALDMLAAIVGHGRSSRLVRNLLERRQVVDSISAFSYTPKEAGLFGIEATMKPEQEADALAALDAEIRSWTERTFTRDELEKARRQMVQQTLAPLQTANGQAQALAAGHFYAADYAYAETYLRRLEALTPERLRETAARYLTDANRTCVILAPARAAPATPPEATLAGGPVQRQTLPNGVTLLVREDRRLPFVHFCAALRGGARDETESDNGLYRLMADLLTRGTGRRTSEAIADTLETLGAELSSFSGYSSFGLKGRALAADLPTLLEVAADCLTDSRFPPDEVAKQKTLQLAALRQQQERPMFHAQRALFEGLFAGHPFRLDPTGTEASLAALTPDACRAAFRRVAGGGNLVLALFGDITPAQARAWAERAFGRMPGTPPPAHVEAPALPASPGRVEKRLPREQTIVLVGFPGATALDPQREAFQLLQTALSGLSSPLMEEIREKRGLAYYAGAYERAAPDCGAFVLYAGTRDDAREEVERLLRGELARIREQGLTETELNRAREQLLAEYQMGLQDNLGLAVTCSLHELIGLGADHLFHTEARLKAVTADAVREAAARLVESQALTVVVRPEAKPATPPDHE